MPNVSRDYAAMPAVVLEAYEALRSPTRVQIVHYLASHPDSQIGELVAGVGGQKTTIREHLRALEQLGVLTPSHEAGERNGRRVTYTVDSERWFELIERLRAYISEALREGQLDSSQGE